MHGDGRTSFVTNYLSRVKVHSRVTFRLVALASATAAQMELRRQTGGFSLLSAKEVQPGVLVFRLRDQTPSATEVLGTLQVRPDSSPATIASFSLRAVHPGTTGPLHPHMPHRDEPAIAHHADLS